MAKQLTLSHSVGYRGLCKLGEDGTVLLCTGGNINLSQDPIMGSGVWGAGYMNAAPISFAWNYLNLEGSANFELTTGGVWQALEKFALAERANEKGYKVVLLPDGTNGFDGNGWCSSLSFDASEGQAITGTFNFKGDPSGGGFSAGATPNTTGYGAGTPGNIAGPTLIPYWDTYVSAVKNEKLEKLEDIINWSVSYNADIQMIKLCNGQQGDPQAPISADYILLGELTAEGNYTVFKMANDFDPNYYHTLRKELKFHLGDAYIQLPQVITSSASTSMATGASYITSEFSFTALGDGENPIFDMSETGLGEGYYKDSGDHTSSSSSSESNPTPEG